MIKINLRFLLCVMLTAFTSSACKKEVIQSEAENPKLVVATSGNVGYTKANNTIERGRFPTKYGPIDGIKFYSKEGRAIFLERSKVRGAAKIYNCVMDEGKYFVNEKLVAGLTQSQLISLAKDQVWPDRVMQMINRF